MICPECEVEVPNVKWRRPEVIKVKMPAPHVGPCGIACKGGMMPSPDLVPPYHVKQSCAACAKKAARAAAAAAGPVQNRTQIIQAPPSASLPPSAKAKAKA